jgi:hypothetical protein
VSSMRDRRSSSDCESTLMFSSIVPAVTITAFWRRAPRLRRRAAPLATETKWRNALHLRPCKLTRGARTVWLRTSRNRTHHPLRGLNSAAKSSARRRSSGSRPSVLATSSARGRTTTYDGGLYPGNFSFWYLNAKCRRMVQTLPLTGRNKLRASTIFRRRQGTP